MTSLPTVLFFTYPEYGQANVQLATSYELALAGVNVHIASFASLQHRVARLQEMVIRHRDSRHSDDQSRGSVGFCECKGFPTFMEAIGRQRVSITDSLHPHGVSGALESYSGLLAVLFPWDPEEHLPAIESIKGVIETVKPDLVVIDLFFYLAMDACQLLGQKFIIILPNSVEDVAVHLQPHFSALWKYPIVSSGFPFPLKWWQIPLNIYLNFRLQMKAAACARVQQIQALRRSLGVKSRAGLHLYPGLAHICPSLPETGFPLEVTPEEMILCGPIVMPFDPVEESDPQLMVWLDKGPTVMVNLGSHFISDEPFAREMASAIRIFLEHHDRRGTGKVQVLWKAKSNADVQQAIDDMIGKEVKEGRVKVVTWLNAEPVSILQHPNVICTVHHGGANSFFEGVWSGLPHIVLPVWADTYQYAARVEFMNVGIFGSKRSAPGVQAEELSEALVRVTGDGEEARTFRSAAQRLKAVCRAKGEGRKLACAAILKEAGITT